MPHSYSREKICINGCQSHLFPHPYGTFIARGLHSIHDFTRPLAPWVGKSIERLTQMSKSVMRISELSLQVLMVQACQVCVRGRVTAKTDALCFNVMDFILGHELYLRSSLAP